MEKKASVRHVSCVKTASIKSATADKVVRNVRTSAQNVEKSARIVPTEKSVLNAERVKAVRAEKEPSATAAAYVKTVSSRFATAATDARTVLQSVRIAERNAKTALMTRYAQAAESASTVSAVRVTTVPNAENVKTALVRYAIADRDALNVPRSAPNAVKSAKTALMTSYAGTAESASTVSAARATTVPSADCVKTVSIWYATAATVARNVQ